VISEVVLEKTAKRFMSTQVLLCISGLSPSPQGLTKIAVFQTPDTFSIGLKFPFKGHKNSNMKVQKSTA